MVNAESDVPWNKKHPFLALILAGLFSYPSPEADRTKERSRLEAPDVETSSHRYKRRFASRSGKWFLDLQAATLLSMLKPWEGASILDVGGGHGQYTELLAEHGYDVTVLGSSPNADEQIRDLVAAGRCRYLVGDLSRFPVDDGSFDIAISFRLLTHLEGWRSFVAEAARAAREAIIVDFPTARSFNIVSPPFFWLKRLAEGNTTRPFSVFHETEVLTAFRDVGFMPTGRQAQFLLPMVLHRVLHAQPLSERMEKACRSLGLTDRFGSPVVVRFERENGRGPSVSGPWGKGQPVEAT